MATNATTCSFFNVSGWLQHRLIKNGINETEGKMRRKRRKDGEIWKGNINLITSCASSVYLAWAAGLWRWPIERRRKKEKESCDCREDWGKAGIIKVLLDEWVSRDGEKEGKGIRWRELEKTNMTWEKGQGGDNDRGEWKENKKRRRTGEGRKWETGRPDWACESQSLFDACLNEAKNTANNVWAPCCFLCTLHMWMYVCVLWIKFLHG